MAALSDSNATTILGPRAPDGPGRTVRYILVADGDVVRAASCVEAAKPFSVGVLVARDGEEALRILQRFGPPILLIVDLSLSRRDGFTLIEALRRGDQGRAGVIAWAAARELREFAANRLAGMNVRVLGAAAREPVVASAIQHALEQPAEGSAPAALDANAVEAAHEVMADLADRARRLCQTPGVAVYLRLPGATKFRASVTWASDDPIPHSPYYVPRVFGWILETGEAVVVPDVAKQRWSDVSTVTLEDVVRGLVAVPITSPEGQTIGSICVFDVKPLTIGEAEISALKALGRSPAIGVGTIGVGTRDVAAPAAAAAPPLREPAQRPEPMPAPEPAAAGHTRERAGDASQPLVWPTALLDRNSGHFAIARELARARREDRPLSLVLFAVATGTPPGEDADDALAAVSETMLRTVRESDVPVQWTADQLLLALPGLAAADARLVAERVRAALQAGARYRASVCAGVVEMRAEDTVASVIMRATEKVAEARDRGRNRVA